MSIFTGKLRIFGTVLALAAAMFFTSASAEAAEAEKTYTVTYRPGNVGHFALSDKEEGTKQEQALAAAKAQYAGYSYEITEKGAIKIKVAENQAAPEAPRYIVAKEGYFVKEAAEWAVDAEKVTKNLDCVVDYGKLVDGVEYRVSYVDSASGASIAPAYAAYANAGESRTVTAPEQIVISGGSIYNRVGDAQKTLVLSADASKNVFEFKYTAAPDEENETVITEYVDGGVIYVTETVIVPEGGGNRRPAAGQDETVIEDEETPLTPDIPGTDDKDKDKDKDDKTEGEDDGDGTEIGDDDPPLNPTIPGESGISNTVCICIACFAGLLVLILLLLLLKKRKKNTAEE